MEIPQGLGGALGFAEQFRLEFVAEAHVLQLRYRLVGGPLIHSGARNLEQARELRVGLEPEQFLGFGLGHGRR